MPRFTRPLIAGVAATSLLLAVGPVAALEAPPGEAASDPVELGLPAEVDLPVPAEDVTQSDESIRSTRNEVTVLVEDGADTPTVTKLRAESAADAAQLAEALDDEPGIVAAPTARLRAFGSLTGEPLSPSLWNLRLVAAPQAWRVSEGAGVVVAVIDTGVDATHPDLAGRVLPEIDLLPDVAPLPEQNGHGTRVASIIAAALDGAGIAGVAPQAGILPVSALDPAGFGDSSTVARAIIEAVDAGARVINLSLGGPDRDPVLDHACSYAFSKGAVVVAAGGNSYLSGNQIQYPAASPHVIGVASVDRTGNPSGFANTGPHIDVAAPGENILAAIPASGGSGPGYNRESGTSYAAPHVAGALALMMSRNPEISASRAASLVQLTAADDLSGNGRDPQLGFGVLRADRAVQSAATMSTSGLASRPKVKLRRLNAKPEPARRGKVNTFVTRVRVKYPDGTWRHNPIPALVRIEFKKSGSRKYRLFAQVASGTDGFAVLEAVPPKSGRWRARVQKPSGKWKKSRSDYLKVRR